jgi:methylated-DNA-[protein]-cysteine S-methyltransferase
MKDVERALARLKTKDDLPMAEFIENAERAGLVDVAYAQIDSPVGRLVAATTTRGLVRLAFPSADDPEGVLVDLSVNVSPRVLEVPARLDPVRRQLDEYFDGRRTSFDVPLDWRLSRGFTRKVLRATARIPYGDVSTYKDIARRAGSERAYRAAGNALGSNPIPIVVPCHRVLQTGGTLGGYGGGPDRKRFLLELEGAL